MEDDEETIVINDLLSFLSCKYKTWPFERLLSDVKRFYPEDEIIQAYRTLRESIQETYELDDKLNSSDEALQAIHNCFLCVSKEHLPVFVCRDLENIPDLTFVKSEIPTHVQEEKQVLEKLLYENHMHMKGRIAHIVSTVNNLSDQLRLFATEVTSATGRQRINGGSAQDKNSHPHIVRNIQESRKSKPNLAYLQKLIDEDEKNTQVCRALDAEVVGEGNSTDEELTGAVIDTQKLRAHKKGSLGNNFNLKTVTLPKCQDEIFASKKRKHDDSVANRKVLHIKSESEDVAVTLIKNEVDRDDYVDELSSDMWMKGEGMHSDGLVDQKHNSNPIWDVPLDVHKGCKALETFPKVETEKFIYSKFSKKEDGYQCLLCLEDFTKKRELSKHMDNCRAVVKSEPSAENEKFTCSVCNVMFASKQSLASHKGYHDPTRRYQCSTCHYRFYTKRLLERHNNIHESGLLKCPYCMYGTKKKSKLETHIRIHTGVKPFECHLCNYTTIANYALVNHLRRHNEEYAFECKICHSKFKTKHRLSLHKMSHTDERPFKCYKCDKAFKTAFSLKRHDLRHLGYKPFSCTVCMHRTRTASSLQSHMNTHKAEKPYGCPFCSFRANQKGYLGWHIKTNH